MKAFHRLHALRMENDAAKFAMDEMRPRFDRLRERHANGTAPRAVVVPQLFQTPPELAQRMAELLNIHPGDRILEPSAGLGRLLDAIATYKPGGVVAIDVSPDCIRELYYQDREGVVILETDFLVVRPSEPAFDCVIMNPPFKNGVDIKHIRHAIDFLKPGGRLVSLCANGPRQQSLKEIANTWEVIPAAFREAGTGVSVVILSIIRY